jgi:hypothetical protein
VQLDCLEICGRVVGTFGPGSKDPRFESQSYSITLSPPHVHQCSLTGLSKAEWCVDSLWFLYLKDPLGSLKKSRGISLAPVGITGPQWCPTAVMGITLNECMQEKKTERNSVSNCCNWTVDYLLFSNSILRYLSFVSRSWQSLWRPWTPRWHWSHSWAQNSG